MAAKHKNEFYKDLAGEWRWRLKSQNGNTIMDSSEGYANKEDCYEAAYNSFADANDIILGMVEALRDAHD
jgi:uncharacterized protein YegP (UPF0339 family)